MKAIDENGKLVWNEYRGETLHIDIMFEAVSNGGYLLLLEDAQEYADILRLDRFMRYGEHYRYFKHKYLIGHMVFDSCSFPVAFDKEYGEVFYGEEERHLDKVSGAIESYFGEE